MTISWTLLQNLDINEVVRQNRTDLRLFQRFGIGMTPDGLRAPIPLELFEAYDNDYVSQPVDDTTGIQTEFGRTADAGATGVSGPVAGLGSYGQVYCDGDDNDEAYEFLRTQPFKFLTNRPCFFGAKIKHTAGSTDGKGTFVVGLMDGTAGGAANTIADTGAIVSTFDGAVFHKVEDGTHIKFTSSNGATQTSSNVVAWTNADERWLEFAYSHNDGTTGKLYFFYDGIYVGTHDITISGLDAAMRIVRGVKTHEAAEQALLYDRIYAYQPK